MGSNRKAEVMGDALTAIVDIIDVSRMRHEPLTPVEVDTIYELAYRSAVEREPERAVFGPRGVADTPAPAGFAHTPPER